MLTELTGAESVRQLPTLKLFKINMSLEMQGDTKDLAAAGAAQDPMEPDPIELSELDVAVIRALQGDMPVVPEPYAPAAAEVGLSQDELLSHLESMRERKALRRVAAILFHRRAGFSANGMGVWKVPEERIMEVAPLMASFRGISHCYQRPTYEDWPYSVFTMAHGRSKEECDAILDSIARGERDRGSPHALLLDRVQEDPPPVLHRRPPPLGGPAHMTSGPSWARSEELYARAVRLLPGGVNSPVRAMKAIGRNPVFVAEGAGAEVVDVDGNRYVDWMCSWGPLIAGHAHPAVVEAVTAAARGGTSFGAPTAAEVELAAEVADRVPGAEMVRMVNSGTEAAMSAHPPGAGGHRPRGAAQVRRRLPRPRGRPAGRGRVRAGHRGDPGVAGGAARPGGGHRDRAVERPRGRERRARAPRVRGDPGRALPGQHGAGAARRRVPGAAPRGAPTPTARCWCSTR